MIYFKEPKLKFNAGGKFLIRFVSFVTYAILIAATVLFLMSDIANLKALGILLVLFFGDRLLQINKGNKKIEEIKRALEQGKKANIADALTPSAYKILNYSYHKALNLNKNFYVSLLKYLIKQSENTAETLKRLDISKKDFLQKLREREKDSEVRQTKESVLASIDQLAKIAYQIADNTSEEYIHPRDFLVALTKSGDPTIERIFTLFDVSLIDLREAVIFNRFRPIFAGIKKVPASLGGFAHRPMFLRKRVMNRSWTARPTPFLDKFSEDLTTLARTEQVGLLIGHQKEYKQLVNTLSRIDKPNALLIGEPGTGKTTLTAHLAFRIIKDKVPKNLFDKRLIQLNIGTLIAEAETQQLAGRLEKIAREIVIAGNIILFIPGIHNLFKPMGGEKESFTAVDILLPIIKGSDIPIIGGTYPQEFKQYIEKRSEFLEQFEKIDVEEVTQEEAIRILTYHALILENRHKILITLRAIKQSVYLAYRYLHQKPLPSNALNLLQQSLTRAKQSGEKKLKSATVIQLTQELSKIPVQKAGDEEVKKLLNLEQTIHQRLINQDTAVKAVSQALREYRSGLSKRGRPIASFLFVGPTGVGKTELSKILAGVQFGSRDTMIRLDMSEYQSKESIQRFIGSPDGERSGFLTDAVFSNPYSLILLDEFEKTHPDILNLFLQVFDDGQLTDSLNRTVNFENTIIIATSNAHSIYIKEEVEKGRDIADIAEELKRKLTKYFKPELLNRFSNIIVFRNLNREEIKKIARILINEVCGSIKESHGIELLVDDPAVAKISDLGYSPIFGARPLRGEISKHIKSILAEKILKDEIHRGDTVKISHNGEIFTFETLN